MTMETSERAQELVQRGKEALQHHHLSEAERLFLGALRCLPNNTKNPQAYEAYHGLARTYTKKGRYCRSDEKEWHRYYLQALCMYRQAIDTAQDQDEEAKVKEELAPVQEIYCQCLETRLFPPPPSSRVRRPQPKVPAKMNSQWLQQLTVHIQTKLDSTVSRESVSTNSVSSEESVPAVPIQQPQKEESNKRGVDFNRVRKTIMRMVKVISADMRSRYLRKRLSQDTLKQAVSSEMLCMLTPENENMDVVSLFESYIVDEQPKFEMEQVEDTKPSSTESESDGTDKDTQAPQKVITPMCSIRESYAVPRTYHHIHSPMRTYHNTDSAVKLNGILRIWRGHDETPNEPTTFIPHKLNFEECSPVTETAKYSFQDIQEHGDSEALSNQKVDVTLATLLSTIADKFSTENKFVPADELYTYALGVYQQYEMQLPAQEGSAIAHLLNSMGKLRCRKGDMIGGTHLMEKSVEMYRQFHGQEEHVDIISVWYELGRAFLYEQDAEDSLLDYVMKTVKSQVDQSKDVQHDEEIDYDSDSDDDDSGAEDSYLLNIHEAKSCFSHALKMLRNLRKNKHEMHNSVYVEVLSKLADCCVMLGDYQKATLCYEEALVLFQNIVGSSQLLLNAHVLTMLGVTNFLLRNYPKAVSMLETAHILQQHMDETEVTFDKAFTLTMLGVTNHAAGHPHKCVAWCLKAHDMYCVLFPDLSKLTALKCWFIIQNVYMLGYAYSCSHLWERALHYLELSHSMVLKSLQDYVSHTAQVVHILKLIAEVYVGMNEPQKALENYECAHEYSVNLGEGQRSNTLHNQLLNCMAGLHITNKNYNTAAQCLEQALDYQENVQDSIKGDMFEMLHSLGLTYTFSGDIDKAIDCYKEAIEAYDEMHGGSPGPEIAGILGRLATLYHVKMCLEENESNELDLCKLAEQYYQQACDLDPCSPITIQFANFQYQQSQTPEALLTMLDFLRPSVKPTSTDVVYNGPEQAVLPSHLQFDVDEDDEVVLEAKIFGHFLAILCFKELNLMKDAEDSVVELYRLVYQTSTAVNFSMLGYGLMEIELFEEAADAFNIALRLDPKTMNSFINVWLCLMIVVYKVLCKASFILLETTSLSHMSETSLSHNLQTWEEEEVVETPPELLAAILKTQKQPESVQTYEHSNTYTMGESLRTVSSAKVPTETFERSNAPVNGIASDRSAVRSETTNLDQKYNTSFEDTQDLQTIDKSVTKEVAFKPYQYQKEHFKREPFEPPMQHVKNTEVNPETYTRRSISSPVAAKEEYFESQHQHLKKDHNVKQEDFTGRSGYFPVEVKEEQFESNLQHLQNYTDVKAERFEARSIYSPVAMDISPDEVADSTATWHDDDHDSNADVLDEMLKSSEEIEAELQQCLRHIDAVQDKTSASTDWTTGKNSSDWRTSTDSALYRTSRGSDDWRTSAYTNSSSSDLKKSLSGSSEDWRTSAYTNSSSSDLKKSSSGSSEDWRMSGYSSDWRKTSGDWRMNRDSSWRRSPTSPTEDNWRISTDSSWRRIPTSPSEDDWRTNKNSSDSIASSTDSTTPRKTPATVPAVTGWRAATSSRTQEILASIQNNNLASKHKSPADDPVKLKDAKEDEEQWQVWEEEEVIETPPELLAAILKAQKQVSVQR